MTQKFEGLNFKITLVGKIEGGDWDHYLWHVCISRAGHKYITSYKTGLGNSVNGKPTVPKKNDVLQSLVLDHDMAEMNFYDFCSELGFNEDSISDFEIYRHCMNSRRKIKKILTTDEIDFLRTI